MEYYVDSSPSMGVSVTAKFIDFLLSIPDLSRNYLYASVDGLYPSYHVVRLIYQDQSHQEINYKKVAVTRKKIFPRLDLSQR